MKEMMRNESIEMGVALHLLILTPHLPPAPLQPFPLIYLTKPVRYINFSPHHLNTLERPSRVTQQSAECQWMRDRRGFRLFYITPCLCTHFG
jgi:hypothetical protein